MQNQPLNGGRSRPARAQKRGSGRKEGPGRPEEGRQRPEQGPRGGSSSRRRREEAVQCRAEEEGQGGKGRQESSSKSLTATASRQRTGPGRQRKGRQAQAQARWTSGGRSAWKDSRPAIGRAHDGDSDQGGKTIGSRVLQPFGHGQGSQPDTCGQGCAPSCVAAGPADEHHGHQ